jgi:hypothetical protein
MTNGQILLLMLAVYFLIVIWHFWKLFRLPKKAKDHYWKLLRDNPENICLDNFQRMSSFWGMSKEMQEYAISVRPDLISKIPELHPELEAKYNHEVELSRVGL